MGKATKLLLMVAGFLMAGAGLLVVGVGFIGIVDLVGAKMSDDSDPFGPIVWFDYISAIVVMLVGLAMIIAGAYLIWRNDK